MPRAISEPTVKVTLKMFRDDYAWMLDQYSDAGGAPRIIRELIRQHREAVLRTRAQSLSAVERAVKELKIELPEGAYDE